MFKAVILTFALLWAAFFLTDNHVGFKKTGEDYISKVRIERGSLKPEGNSPEIFRKSEHDQGSFKLE